MNTAKQRFDSLFLKPPSERTVEDWGASISLQEITEVMEEMGKRTEFEGKGLLLALLKPQDSELDEIDAEILELGRKARMVADQVLFEAMLQTAEGAPNET